MMMLFPAGFTRDKSFGSSLSVRARIEERGDGTKQSLLQRIVVACVAAFSCVLFAEPDAEQGFYRWKKKRKIIQ